MIVDHYRVWFDGNTDTIEERVEALTATDAVYKYSEDMYDPETDADPSKTRVVIVQARTKDFDVVSMQRFAVNTRNQSFFVRKTGEWKSP